MGSRRSKAVVVLALAMAGALLISCSARSDSAPIAPATPRITPPAVAGSKPRDYPGLRNVVAYHEGFLCGAVPEDDAGFETLAAMGVRTIISVDGAEPDVARAKARGMRYVHLPIGYNGFDESRKLELVRATRDLLAQGPVYIHCHHGKHRSAGAAATVGVSLGWMDPAQGIALMKVSGTAPEYAGLYHCAADATPLSSTKIDSVAAHFPEVARPAGFVKAMVEVDEAAEHLKAVEQADWQVPANHPDLVPAAEAGRIADVLRALAEGDRAKARSAEFAAGLLQSSRHAQALEDLLAAGEKDRQKLSRQRSLLANSCRDCHARHRD